ncbi:MAG: cyclic nucleotide-binding domain-containing protein [Ignavibacteria bacterium]|jgi:voltage-gated potassium channel
MFYNNKIFITSWNIVVTICASFSAVFIPLDFLFGLRHEFFYFFSTVFVTVVFVVDIFFSIAKSINSISYLHDNNAGLKNYLQGWFIIDLLAAIPFGFLFHPSLLQFIRILKLAKVLHYMRIWKHEWIKYSTYFVIGFFLFWIAHLTHWISCGWLALRGYDDSLDNVTNYIKSLYWSITTLTTVGYGDITPATNLQYVYTIIVEILGVGFYGYLIGNIASILSKRNPARIKYQENLDKLSALTMIRHLPLDLSHKIREYYTYMFNSRMGYNEDAFLKDLPQSLKTEVALHLKKEVLEKIDLFKDADVDFIREIALHLKPLVYTPGDIVIRKGDEGKEMFFVVKGELAVYSDLKKEPVAVLSDGDFFGEISLFGNKPRTATIKAITYCDLYSLSKNTFDYVVAKYRDVIDKIEKKARLREPKNEI